MEPIRCAHPACGRFTFDGPKCARHTFEAAEEVLDASHSARPGTQMLDADAARGIPAVFGGSVRVSRRWQSSATRVRNPRVRRQTQTARVEAAPVAAVGNAARYERLLATVGATGDSNH